MLAFAISTPDGIMQAGSTLLIIIEYFSIKMMKKVDRNLQISYQ